MEKAFKMRKHVTLKSVKLKKIVVLNQVSLNKDPINLTHTSSCSSQQNDN